MATMADMQRQSFQERIQRIQKGAPNTIREGQLAALTEVQGRSSAGKRTAKAQEAALRKLRGDIKPRGRNRLSAVMLALAVGAASLVAGRAVAYRLSAEGGILAQDVAGIPAVLFGDVAIAACLAILLTRFLGFTSRPSRVAVVIGFAAMMASETFLVRAYPDVFSAVYSESFVASTLAAPVALL